jgi:pyruvate dehydrogenase (quinone)
MIGVVAGASDRWRVVVDPELRFLLRPALRGGTIVLPDDGTSTPGHVVESLGIPLPEVGRLEVSRRGPETHVEVRAVRRPQRLPDPARFLLDVHLGGLARRLWLLGVDAAYRNDADDDALVERARREGRVLLTQDRGLLRRRALPSGAYVRGGGTAAQLDDVLDRFAPALRPWTRCGACGGPLRRAARDEVEHLLQPGTRRTYHEFARCTVCGRPYWRGAHAGRLDAIVARARSIVEARPGTPARMAQRLVADVVVERLRSWQVPRVFGYSGYGVNALLGALRRAGEPAFVQARHEEAAAFMAVGHAKYAGGVGVVLSTQGPGAVHLLTGLYDAKLDGVPVVALMGQQQRTVLGSQYQQEIDLLGLVKDVAAQFAQVVTVPEQVPMVLDRAFRTALATRSPTVVVLPHDVQQLPAADPGHEHGQMVTAPRWRAGRLLPHEQDLRAAAGVLDAGSRVAMLVGQGARDARQEVVAVAERLGAGIATSLLGKPCVDESLPFVAGTMGHLGTTASAFLLGRCDTLLVVGSNDPWTEFYPPPGQARAVQIDLDGRHLGNRYPVEVALPGDAAETLRALLPLLRERTDTAWRDQVVDAVRAWHRLAAARAGTRARPVNPELVVRELSARLPGDAQVAVDVGSVTYWYARQLRLPPGVPAHLSSTLASMGCAVPYALAAKLAAPERPLVALSGDGAMQMLGNAELVTVASRWRDWADPRFVVCVLANRDLAEVTWEQRETEGDPRFDESQALPAFPFAAYADLLGLTGVRVEDPADVGPAWDRALSADRPVVLEVVTDPDVPLLPPFPAGESALETIRAALSREGGAGAHASDLLETYAEHERRLRGW